MNNLQPFLVALQFLTRIPVSKLGQISEKDIGRSLLFYPIIGCIIGLLLFLLASITSGTSSLLSSVMVLSFWVIITGGLHIDGLADSADAWAGGFGDQNRTLEIMKDPRSGPIAITVVMLILLLKLAAIQVLIESDAIELLIIVPIIARLFMPILFVTTPYVRENGLGSTMKEHLPETRDIAIMTIMVCVFIIFFGFIGLYSILASGFFFIFLRKFMMARIAGMTGDTAGATLEIIEVVALVTIAVMLPV